MLFLKQNLLGESTGTIRAMNPEVYFLLLAILVQVITTFDSRIPWWHWAKRKY